MSIKKCFTGGKYESRFNELSKTMDGDKAARKIISEEYGSLVKDLNDLNENLNKESIEVKELFPKEILNLDFEKSLIKLNNTKSKDNIYNYLYTKSSSKSIYRAVSRGTVVDEYLDIRDKVFGGKFNNTDSRTIIRNILRNVDINNTTKEILKSLLLRNIPVKFMDIHETAMAQYNPTKNEIQVDHNEFIKMNMYQAVEVLLHEIMHGYTYGSVSEPQNEKQREFRDNIKSLYNVYLDFPGSNHYLYGFKNEHEFISEIVSNPIFREHIDSLKIDERESFLDRIINYIKSLLGINREKNSDEIVRTIIDAVTNEEFNPYSFLEDHNDGEILFKRDDKYSPEFQKEINSLDKVLDKIMADIDSVSAKSAAVRGKKDENSKRFKNVNKLIKELADTSANAAIYKFLEFANSELHKLNKSLSNKIRNGKVGANYLYRAKSYAAIYNSLDDIKAVLQHQYDNNTIEKDEYDELVSSIDRARSSYDSFNVSYINEAKEILTDKLAPLNMKPYDRRKVELEREYNTLYPGKKDRVQKEQWIKSKLDKEIDTINQKQWEETRKLMDEVPMDIQSIESMITSEKNLPDLLLKLFSMTLDKIELDLRNKALAHRKSFKDTLREYNPEGTNNLSKYENIISKDEDGNHFLISKFKPEFMRKQKELAKARKEAVDEFGKKSDEYKKVNSIYKKWMTSNTVLDKNGITKRPSDKWLDKRYSSLNERDSKYLAFLVDKIKTADNATLGYRSLIHNINNAEFIRLPAVRRSDLDRIMSGDGKGLIQDKIVDFYKVTQDTTTMGEIQDIEKPNSNEFVKALTTVNNEERFLVPIHFRNNISPKDQSLDIPTIIMMNSVMSDEFKGKHDIEAESNLLLEIVGKAKVYKTEGTSRKLIQSVFGSDMKKPKLVWIDGVDSNLYKKLSNVIQNRVYNILDASGNRMSRDNVTVMAKSILGYTAHLTLAVNWLSAIPNMFQGKLQNSIEAVGGATYSRKDIQWAERTYWQEMAREGFDDIGKRVDESKLNLIIDYLNVMTDFNMKKHDFEKNNKVKSMVNTGTLHGFNNMAEHYAQGTLMLSVLSYVKAMNDKGEYIDSNGNRTDRENAMNMYDAFNIKDDGSVGINPVVKRTSFNPDRELANVGLVQVQNLVRKKVMQLHGQYDNKLQSTLQRYWYGKAIAMFRKWLIPGFYRRWRGMYYIKKDYADLTDNQKYYSAETRQFEEGTYTSFVRLFNNLFLKGTKELKLEIMERKWDSLTDYEKGNVHKTIKELIITLLMFIAAMITSLAASDENDEDTRRLLFILAYIFRRQESELMQYYSIPDTLRLFRSPFAALSSLEKIGGTINQLAPWNIDETYKTGDRKGEYKAWVKTKKIIPVISQGERSAENSFNYLENLLSY